jgi:hypothetical protein
MSLNISENNYQEIVVKKEMINNNETSSSSNMDKYDTSKPYQSTMNNDYNSSTRYNNTLLGLPLPIVIPSITIKLAGMHPTNYTNWKQEMKSFFKLYGVSSFVNKKSNELLTLAYETDTSGRSPSAIKFLLEQVLGKVRGAIETSLGTFANKFTNQLALHSISTTMTSDIDIEYDANALWELIVNHFEQKTAFSAIKTLQELFATRFRSSDDPMNVRNRIDNLMMQLIRCDAFKSLGNEAQESIKSCVFISAMPADLINVQQTFWAAATPKYDDIYDTLRRAYESRFKARTNTGEHAGNNDKPIGHGINAIGSIGKAKQRTGYQGKHYDPNYSPKGGGRLSPPSSNNNNSNSSTKTYHSSKHASGKLVAHINEADASDEDNYDSDQLFGCIVPVPMEIKTQHTMLLTQNSAVANAITYGDGVVCSENEWIYDTGAFAHFTYASYATDIEKLRGPIRIMCANRSTQVVTHYGRVRLTNKFTLCNVLILKGAGANLVSAACIHDAGGFKVEERRRKITIYHEDEKKNTTEVVVFERPQNDSLYRYKCELHGDTRDQLKEQRDAIYENKHKATIPKKSSIKQTSAPNSSSSSSSPSSSTTARAELQEARQSNRPPPPLNPSVSFMTLATIAPVKYELLAPVEAETQDKKLSLYHSRYVHASNKALSATNDYYDLGIAKRSLVHDTTCICRHCLNGKARRAPIHRINQSSNYIPAAAPFDRLSTDVGGPMAKRINGKSVRVRSIGGNLYYMLVIDEYTKYWWCFPMKAKSEASSLIRELVVLIKTQFERTVKEIHSDGGGEYINTLMESFCRTHGIKQTYTTAHTPQHNAASESANGIAIGGVRAMLSESNARELLWADALMHFTYVHNRIPTVYEAIKPNTKPASELAAEQPGTVVSKVIPISPYEKLTKHKPDESKIKVFGCDAFIIIPKTQRSKLNMLTENGIYLGVDEQQNCYRILNPVTLIMVYTRDVRFNETSFEHQKLLKSQFRTHLPLSIDNYWDVVQENELDENEEQNDAPSLSKYSGIIDLTDQNDPNNNEVIVSDDIISQPVNSDGSTTSLDDDNIPELPEDEYESIYHRDENHQRIKLYPNQPSTANTDSTNSASQSQASTDANTELDTDKNELSNDSGVLFDDSTTTPNLSHNSNCEQEQNATVYSTRSGREVHPVDRLMYAIGQAFSVPLLATGVTGIYEPQCYKQAMSTKEKEKWLAAMIKELDSLKHKRVYDLVELPANAKALHMRWVYKVKHNSAGEPDTFKARVVVKGYEQRPGIDFDKTQAPVSNAKSIKLILAIAAKEDLHLYQIDVETAFLNADLDETIYVHPPEGFVPSNPKLVWLLKKALYGLRQSPRCWNKDINGTMIKLGYHPIVSDSCIYVKRTLVDNKQHALVICSLYVDDTIIACNDAGKVIWFEDQAKLSSIYQIKVLGECNWILNMGVIRDRTKRTIRLSQEVYVNTIIDRFDMKSSKPTPTPAIKVEPPKLKEDETPIVLPVLDKKGIKMYQSIVGALMYAAMVTRIDIAYAVNMLSRHLSAPTEAHVTDAKRVLRYLNGTPTLALLFGNNCDTAPMIEAFTDADWGNDRSDRKSITGTIIKCFGSTVSWISKKQSTVALSSAESEYMAISSTLQEIRWIKTWLKEVLLIDIYHIPIYSDSQSAIAITDTGGSHQRTKHIDIRHHHIREHIANNLIELFYVPTTIMQADILTKALQTTLHQRHTSFLMS